MNGRSYCKRLATRFMACALALTLGWTNAPANAQVPDALPPYNSTLRSADGTLTSQETTKPAPAPAPAPTPAPAPAPAPAPIMASEPMPAAVGCNSCAPSRGGCSTGGCSSGSCGGGTDCARGCNTCGGGGCMSCGYKGCFPGHVNCCGCEACGPLGKFFCCFYECLCCPDPCYEPCYRPEAHSAFFVDGTRPATETRIRWDSGHNLRQPDRSEFFWARHDGKGLGPNAPAERRVNWDALTIYQEAATKRASIFIEQDYRTVDPDVARHKSGFGDMNIGTKALLFDCELLQITFQMRTYIPVGNTGAGLGTGHVSLEPSALFTVKLLPETYFQGQVSEWIPLGGNPDYAGAVLHYHFALNHVLYRFQPEALLIGGIEMNAYSFQDGQFTDATFGSNQPSSGETWLSFGPSIRFSLCNKLDAGFSAMFGTDRGPGQLYRTEFRFRF